MGERGRMGGRRFGSGGLLGRRVLGGISFPSMFWDGEERRADLPFRTNITPDQSVGSPGVRDMKTPCGEAYFRLELWVLLVKGWGFRRGREHNSTSRCCFRTAERLDKGRGTIFL